MEIILCIMVALMMSQWYYLQRLDLLCYNSCVYLWHNDSKLARKGPFHVCMGELNLHCSSLMMYVVSHWAVPNGCLLTLDSKGLPPKGNMESPSCPQLPKENQLSCYIHIPHNFSDTFEISPILETVCETYMPSLMFYIFRVKKKRWWIAHEIWHFFYFMKGNGETFLLLWVLSWQNNVTSEDKQEKVTNLILCDMSTSISTSSAVNTSFIYILLIINLLFNYPFAHHQVVGKHREFYQAPLWRWRKGGSIPVLKNSVKNL